jgi:predicted PurR-regulated permease PerM
MRRYPRIIAIVSIVVGAIAIVVGITTFVVIDKTLRDQHITVADDAPFLAGEPVTGPFTAYAQAIALSNHAKSIGGGKTYAELPKDDPNRNTVMTADFLQSSLYTSVVAFGVAVLVVVLGAMFLLVGFALRELDRRTGPTAAEVPDEVTAKVKPAVAT